MLLMNFETEVSQKTRKRLLLIKDGLKKLMTTTSAMAEKLDLYLLA
jgi:hypothetical protein